VRDLGRSLQQLPIANDVAKYFAIIPAAFASTYPQLRVLDVMHLTTPASAILSAVIFNAVIIVMLIPLALKGVKYRAIGAAALLRRNLLIYGLGGLILPLPVHQADRYGAGQPSAGCEFSRDCMSGLARASLPGLGIWTRDF